MRWLITLVGVIASAEIYFATGIPLRLDAGIAFLLAAPLAALWAYCELVRKDGRPSDNRLRAERGLIFGYECLIIGSANTLARPHVLHFVATGGAVVLIGGQSLILWLVFKNPGILKPVERPPSVKDLPVRTVVSLFFYLAVGILACAVFIPRSPHAIVRTIPVEFQWPGIALLYAAFGCLALGIAAEHSRSGVWLYLVVLFLAAVSVWMEFVGRRDWYFLALSLFAFLCLVPGWPRPVERVSSDPSLRGVPEANG